MRLIIVALSLCLLSPVSMSVWAGTFKDDFEDGDWSGWQMIAGLETKVEEGCSIAEGVLRIDAMNKPEDQLSLYMMEDWKDYSFSADMRITEVEPVGGH